jgi:Dolichyl-phosphate-mannose-protein mannosyltransferase
MVRVAAGPGPARSSIVQIARIVVSAFAFRVVSAVLAFLCNVVFPLDQPEQFPSVFGPFRAFWDPFTRYDGGWYYQIARNGYQFVVGGPAVGLGKPGKIAYFPVYPLLMRYAGRLFGTSPADVYFGGILVSWLAFVLAMVLLLKLAMLDVDDEQAERAVHLLAIFPFAFFFGVVYTEATFLLFVLAAFYLFRTRWWILGGLFGALATATRVNGILILPALAWIAWRRAEPNTNDRLRASIGLALVACGIGAYTIYVYILSGHPFEWASAIRRWGYEPGGAPWLALVRLVRSLTTHPLAFLTSSHAAPYDVLNGLTGLAFVVAIPLVWWRLGAAYGLYMLANLWLPLSSGQYEGLGRYCAVLFPFFILVAGIRWRAGFVAIVAVSALLYTICLALFTTIHPLF